MHIISIRKKPLHDTKHENLTNCLKEIDIDDKDLIIIDLYWIETTKYMWKEVVIERGVMQG